MLMRLSELASNNCDFSVAGVFLFSFLFVPVMFTHIISPAGPSHSYPTANSNEPKLRCKKKYNKNKILEMKNVVKDISGRSSVCVCTSPPVDWSTAAPLWGWIKSVCVSGCVCFACREETGTLREHFELPAPESSLRAVWRLEQRDRSVLLPLP